MEHHSGHYFTKDSSVATSSRRRQFLLLNYVLPSSENILLIWSGALLKHTAAEYLSRTFFEPGKHILEGRQIFCELFFQVRFRYIQFRALMTTVGSSGIIFCVAIIVAIIYARKRQKQNEATHLVDLSPMIPLHVNPLSDKYMFNVSDIILRSNGFVQYKLALQAGWPYIQASLQ